MFLKSRSLLLATSLMAGSITLAMAQPTNPAGNQGSNNSATASSGTADNKSASGMNTADAGSHPPAIGNYSHSASNNPQATHEQQTGGNAQSGK